jgi:hypothetical protein
VSAGELARSFDPTRSRREPIVVEDDIVERLRALT